MELPVFLQTYPKSKTLPFKSDKKQKLKFYNTVYEIHFIHLSFNRCY